MNQYVKPKKNTDSSYKFRTIEALMVETESIYLLAGIQSTSCHFDSSFATYSNTFNTFELLISVSSLSVYEFHIRCLLSISRPMNNEDDSEDVYIYHHNQF
jgi:hypothetical protein